MTINPQALGTNAPLPLTTKAVYLARVKEDWVGMMERDEIEFPDFPGKREEAWMTLETDVREHRSRVYPDSDCDNERIVL